MALNLRNRNSRSYYEPNGDNENGQQICEPVKLKKDVSNIVSGRTLRQRKRINYYEPDEPSFDEYEFCEECSDYVFEYCAIHGPLLVIPDDKVPAKPNVPAVVPRAALTIPHVFLHLAPSIIPGAGIGVFSTLTVPRGVRFGPYLGDRAVSVDSMYCWQIYDRNNKRSHVVDAADSQRSNWMRYVNCARHWTEQNLVAYQYRGQLYYRTIKIIPRFTELLVFYGSEFANNLRINLSKYNTAAYYYEVIYASRIPLQNAKSNSAEKGLQLENEENFNTEMSENNEELLNFNDFQIVEANENEKNEELLNFNDFKIIDANENEKNNEELFNFNDFKIIEANENEKHNEELLNFNDFKIIEINDNESFEEENTITLNFTEPNTNNTRFKCDKCNKTYAKKRYLTIHAFSHSDKPKFQCPQCPYSTSLKYTFNRHYKNHAKQPNFVCKLCNFNTNIKNQYVRHIYKHNLPNVVNTSSYYSTLKTCEICDFSTCSRKSFQTHMLKHKGIIYQCKWCSYKNYSKINYSKHLIRKHGYKKEGLNQIFA